MNKAENLSEQRARWKLESFESWPEGQGMGTSEAILEADLRFAFKLIDVLGYSWERVVARAHELGGMPAYRRQMEALFA
jgi:hypothetical protein